MFGGTTPSSLYSDDLYIVDLERHSVVSVLSSSLSLYGSYDLLFIPLPVMVSIILRTGQRSKNQLVSPSNGLWGDMPMLHHTLLVLCL